MSRDLRRRDFIATATASGFVGIAGCGQSDSDTQTTGAADPATQTTASADTGTRTPEPTESQPTTEDYLSGEAVSIFGTPLADATVRILAKPENSYTARAEAQPHEELGRTRTQSDGSFQFTEFPASDFETLRQERDLVMVLFTHPDGWFTGGNYTTNLVFDSETILGRIRPVWKYVIRPTAVTDTAGRRRGAVSVWKWFHNDDPTQQRVGVEVTATNPRSDRNVYDINEGDLTLGTGSFSLEVPEQGIEVDYENVSIERANPSGDIISAKPGIEEPSKAIEKWHPARSVDGLELGVPARFMTRDLFTELTEEDIERAEEKRKVVNFVFGAAPVVGDVMQLISAMQIVFDLFDAGEATDPSQWPSIGNALGRAVDRNESDVVTAGVNQNVVSAVMTVPYRITDESSHELAVRGLWQGDFGEGRLGQRVSAAATEPERDTPSSNLSEGLLNYYQFNEGSGGEARDQSDRGLDLTLGVRDGNPPEWTEEARAGTALSFDADNQEYIGRDADLRWIEYPEFSVSVWVKPEDISDVRGVWQADAGNNQRVGALRSDALIYEQSEDYGNTGIWEASYTFNSDEWYHLVWTFSEANDDMRFYVNGDQIRRWNVAEDLSPDYRPIERNDGGYLGRGSHPLTGADQNVYFDGIIDEVRVYDRSLSTTEVGKLFDQY